MDLLVKKDVISDAEGICTLTKDCIEVPHHHGYPVSIGHQVVYVLVGMLLQIHDALVSGGIHNYN